MWPTRAETMGISSDLASQSTVAPKTYMVGVFPWFSHSATGRILWIWRGNDLWIDQGAQVIGIMPDFGKEVCISKASKVLL